MSIELLPPEEWPGLDSIYEREFKSAMPDPAQAAILVCREGEEVRGFLAMESVVWLPELYVAPGHRGGPTAVRLLKFVEERLKGRTVLCTPDSEQVAQMCEAFSMRRIAGTIYRKVVG